MLPSVDPRENYSLQYTNAYDFAKKHIHLLSDRDILDISAYCNESISVVLQDFSKQKIKMVHGSVGFTSFVNDYRGLKYQVVTCFNKFHLVSQDEQKECLLKINNNLLTDDGAVLFMIPGRSDTFYNAIEKAINQPCWNEYFSTFHLSSVRTYQNADYYKALFETAGFSHVESYQEHCVAQRPLNFFGVKNFLSEWLPHLDFLISNNAENDVRELLLTDIVQRYFDLSSRAYTDTVRPVITQNFVVAYKAGFFSRNENVSHAVNSERELIFF